LHVFTLYLVVFPYFSQNMNTLRILVFFIAPLILLSACDTDSSIHGFDFNFENLTSKPINVKIYKSQSDYDNNTNVYLSGKMQVRGYYTIPVDQLVTGETYYVDWYSDDLLYTNWYWSNITLRTTFTVSDLDYEYLVNTVQYPDPSRSIWMNGLGTQTTWKATDAYQIAGTTYSSIWATLSSAQQNVQIILNKDFSAHLLLKNASNQIIDSVLSFRPNYDNTNMVSIITLVNNMQDTVGTLTSNFAPSTSSFNGANSVMLANLTSIGYFQMVLQ
jgi:hypothetical protein